MLSRPHVTYGAVTDVARASCYVPCFTLLMTQVAHVVAHFTHDLLTLFFATSYYVSRYFSLKCVIPMPYVTMSHAAHAFFTLFLPHVFRDELNSNSCSVAIMFYMQYILYYIVTICIVL